MNRYPPFFDCSVGGVLYMVASVLRKKPGGFHDNGKVAASPLLHCEKLAGLPIDFDCKDRSASHDKESIRRTVQREGSGGPFRSGAKGRAQDAAQAFEENNCEGA